MTRGRIIAIAATVAVFVLLLREAAVLVVDARWYAAFGPGASAVWRARLVDLTLLRAFGTLAGGAFVFANLLGVASSIDTIVFARRLGGIDIAERVAPRQLTGALAAAAAVIGLATSFALDDWIDLDASLTGLSFSEIEPYTGHDLAFFVHGLPLEASFYLWALLVVVVAGGIVLVAYALTPGLRWVSGRLRMTRRVRRHLSLFGVAILLLLAWGQRLDAYTLLGDGSGANGAFVAVDQIAVLPARFGLAIATALGALVVLRAGWAGQARVAFWTVTTVLVLTVAVRLTVTPIAAAAIPPDALAAAERAASANRALYTQRAFGADAVTRLPADYGFASPAAAAAATPDWDDGAIRRAVAPDPGVGTVAIATEVGDDGRAVVYTLRSDSTPRTAPVTHLRALATASGLGGDGLLTRPAADVPAIIFPGARGAVVVDDSTHAIVGDLGDRWLARAAHALAHRDLRLAAARGAPVASRIVIRRDPIERVAQLAPFFAPSLSPAPVVVGDTLWWSIALYVANGDYPLSERLPISSGEPHAYLRHAATALVNARTGAVHVVLVPSRDAETRAWAARFPRLFTGADRLPPALARAMPAPLEGPLAQAYVFAQYGRRGERPVVLRRLPPSDGGDALITGSGRANSLLPVPPNTRGATGLVPSSTLPLLSPSDRVDGVIAAFGGASPDVRWIPTDATSPRWQELLDELAPDSIATRSELANAVVRGRLRGVPIGGRLAFAQAAYRVDPDGRPTLTSVAVRWRDSTTRGSSLAAALGVPPDSGRVRAVSPAADSPRALYERMRDALRRGAWDEMGRAFDALGRALGVPR